MVDEELTLAVGRMREPLPVLLLTGLHSRLGPGLAEVLGDVDLTVRLLAVGELEVGAQQRAVRPEVELGVTAALVGGEPGVRPVQAAVG